MISFSNYLFSLQNFNLYLFNVYFVDLWNDCMSKTKSSGLHPGLSYKDCSRVYYGYDDQTLGVKTLIVQ